MTHTPGGVQINALVAQAATPGPAAPSVLSAGTRRFASLTPTLGVVGTITIPPEMWDTTLTVWFAVTGDHPAELDGCDPVRVTARPWVGDPEHPIAVPFATTGTIHANGPGRFWIHVGVHLSTPINTSIPFLICRPPIQPRPSIRHRPTRRP